MSHLHPTSLAGFAAILLAGLWMACTTEPDSMSKDPVMVASRVLSIADGTTDTAVTLLRYDSTGILTREIRSTTVREWDSLGRYKGVRVKDSARYVEHVEWITADSAVRTQGTTLINDRFFNRRPNCWCADSIQHTLLDSIRITRKFRFDAAGNPLYVTLTWANDGHTESVQSYQNTYDNHSRLVKILVQDIEAGSLQVTTRLIEYDTLKNVVESR